MELQAQMCIHALKISTLTQEVILSTYGIIGLKKNTLTPAGFAYYFTINDRIIEAFNGGVIWLTSNGDICYRFAPNGKVHTAPIAKINLVFSNFVLQYNIFITEVL